MNRCPYLIIGNSAAAMGAIEGIRERDPVREITVVSREPYHTYSKPLISYLLAGKVDEAKMPYRPADYYEENNVRALLGVEATHVNVKARTVETSDGGSIAFEKLLIATGGTPIVPQDVEGTDAEGVFTFTTWDDARRIKGFIEANGVTGALVVGGGLIGLKSVEALVGLGIRTTVLELADRIMSVGFDHKASDLAQKALGKAGVEVRCETTVSRIEQIDGKVAGAALRGGSRVDCQMVIFAIGVVPSTGIVEGTRIETDRGILVDDFMATSVGVVYAAGDVAEAVDLLTGKKRPIAIFPNAYRQGNIAGLNMAGGQRSYEGGLSMNAVDICGLPTISVGITSPEDDDYEILSVLEEEQPVYKKLLLRNERIVGAIFIGQIDRAGIITGLIRDRVEVTTFKDVLLSDEFGLISLPKEYRKHVVSGAGIEV